MTISSTTRTAGPVTGNGVATGLPFTFKIFNATEMTVVETNTSNVDRTLVYATDFSVSLNPNQDTSPGGTINYLIAGIGPSLIPTGYVLNATSNVANLQPVNLTNNGGFFPAVLNAALDRLTILVQQLGRSINSSLKFPLSDGTSINTTLPNAAARANQALLFDATGAPVAGAIAGAPVSSAMQPVVAASTLALARAALGATAIGEALFTAASATAGRTTLSAELIALSQTTAAPATDDFVIISDTSAAGISRKALISAILALGTTVDNSTQDFRLTLTTAVPVTTADVTGATTVYCTPKVGNRIALYSGSTWNVRTSAEFSLALGTLVSGRNYDVFCYDNSTVPTLEFLVWTNDTTRATALTTQDGVLVKSGDATRRYMGTFRTTATTTTEDSFAKRFLWNYYNRVARPLSVVEATASWVYTTATYRQANGAAANQLDYVVGVSEDMVEAKVTSMAGNSGGTSVGLPGVGVDSTSVNSAQIIVGNALDTGNANGAHLSAHYRGFPGAGRHTLVWLEYSSASGTTTWYSNNLGGKSGIQGTVIG